MALLCRLVLLLACEIAVVSTAVGCGRACGSVYVPSEVRGSISVNASVPSLDRATLTICKNGQCASSVLEVGASGSDTTALCVQSADSTITCNVNASGQGSVVSLNYKLDGTTTSASDVYTFTLQQPGSASPVLSTTRVPQYTTGEPNGEGCGTVTIGTI